LQQKSCVLLYPNFIGAFELPADFITTMEIEEQRQAEEAQAEKVRLAKEREKERYTAKNEENRQKSKEFYARRAPTSSKEQRILVWKFGVSMVQLAIE